MKVVFHRSHNDKIEIIKLFGGLNGNGALELKNRMFSHMDENMCKKYAIIDFERVNKIDGLGIDILEYFVQRGINIYLFNVKMEIRSILDMAGKKEIIDRIYDETDGDRAISMLEKDILEKSNEVEKNIRMRGGARIETLFPVNFKYSSNKNETILCSANVQNISECGIFISEIKSVDLKKKKNVNCADIVGQEFYDIRFELGKGSKTIETDGVYVWNNLTNDNFGIGIRFKNMLKDYRQIIRHYVYNVFRPSSRP